MQDGYFQVWPTRLHLRPRNLGLRPAHFASLGDEVVEPPCPLHRPHTSSAGRILISASSKRQARPLRRALVLSNFGAVQPSDKDVRALFRHNQRSLKLPGL